MNREEFKQYVNSVCRDQETNVNEFWDLVNGATMDVLWQELLEKRKGKSK